MAIKEVCDRCGKEIGCWQFKPRVEYPIVSILNFTREGDLCYDCAKDMQKFMEGAKVVS